MAERTDRSGTRPADYAEKISARHWNLPGKGEMESARERTFIDDIVQKSHLEKELLSALDGVETVFDAGAGAGRFSILLARRGIRVTHFDISQPMIDKAKELAAREGAAENITFVRGALEDLSMFDDRSFDMVISFDAPVSYTYPRQEEVVAGLVRLAKKKIMLSVASRLGSLPYFANPSPKLQFLLDEGDDGWVRQCVEDWPEAVERYRFDEKACRAMMETGLFGPVEREIAAYERGEAPWPITYEFMPAELSALLEKNGVRNLSLAGPGAFARTVPREILLKIMSDERQRADFLDFCHDYDSNPAVCGMGKDNLFAKGDILPETDQ